jgi:hypothetical protein
MSPVLVSTLRIVPLPEAATQRMRDGVATLSSWSWFWISLKLIFAKVPRSKSALKVYTSAVSGGRGGGGDSLGCRGCGGSVGGSVWDFELLLDFLLDALLDVLLDDLLENGPFIFFFIFFFIFVSVFFFILFVTFFFFKIRFLE